MHTLQYAPGRAVDVIGEAGAVVLMWHGAQTDARTTMRPLAELVAGHGLTVVVPDWDSHAPDGGRADLVGSLEFVRERADVDRLLLVGWSLGGAAAAGVAINAGQFDVAVAHTVCLAGAFIARSPITGAPLPTQLPNNPSPFTLLHGAADDVVPVEVSRSFAAKLRDSGWPVEYVELAADHGAIAGATYDRAGDRYLPSDDPAVLAVAADVAGRIASATGVDLNNG
ncbi:esterase [Mycobacterium sp. ACS1612]|uniref:alpha/beta hydrolase family protein n=1 Tax=Mycobacterium sp. ACS1612 TaxID=1834117 RepID=UPI0007FE9097|nr:alpha/beta fold hydrolase [Mycobacterium sp. ACS1612]OBF33619.1 esterase [Mycobacterium sp. ACS1612]